MDSGLEECILPSIRRSQMFLIYRNGGVVNPETLWSDRMLGRGYQKDGDPRSGPLRGRETSQEQDNYDCFRADTGVCPYDHFCHQFPGCMDTSPAYVHAVDDPSFVLAGLPTERGS